MTSLYLYLSRALVAKTSLDAAKGADAVIILTDWEEFKDLDWKNIFLLMRKPAWVFDTRICIDQKFLKNIGFKVWTLGTSD